MNGTIIQQGRFTSDGAAKTLDIRSDVDWIEVKNETQWATTQTPGRGVKFEWNRGLATDHAFEYTKADGANTLQAEKITSGGFILLPETFSLVTGTTITKADPPVCTATAHGFSNNDLVVFENLTNMSQIALVAFSIGSVSTNTFELTYFNTNTANFTAESAFSVRKVDPFTWRGSWNNVTAVTTGSTTQVQLAALDTEVDYAVGALLSFNIPSAFGMIELNGKTAEVLSVNSTTNTYTIDLDSTSFTAFAWPASSAVPFSLPQVRDVGNVSLNPSGAVTNLEMIGIKLGAGIDGPAGSTSDVIYWKAGKSFSISNS